jgi:hypothetical protein
MAPDRTDSVPVEAFLAGYPDGIRTAAARLRAIVKRAVPGAIERVRPGWRLIGYDVPIGRRAAYFGYVAPEAGHVHLGFEHGIFLTDPNGLLEGAHLRLRKIRFVTYEAGQPILEDPLVLLTREAARIASMSRAERFALLLDRDAILCAKDGW